MTSFDTTNWRSNKIRTLEELELIAEALRKQGQRLVTVNGCFDILHVGHLDQLEEAKRQGDVLFVGINSDASIRSGKEEDRPFISEQARAAMLAALECVGYVTVIDGPYGAEIPQALLNAVRPHVHVNGPDYGSPPEWIEWPTMQKYGTQGYVVQRRNTVSVTNLIAIIRRTTG